MKQTIIFLALLTAVAIYFDYPTMYDYLPMSTHQWRQSDGASMALNYYQNGMNFLQPQIHNVLSGNGYGVGEFPGLYYFIAVLYQWFGQEEGIFRLVNFLIFAFGLLALSKVIWKITGDELLSYAIPILVMASPIIAFYAFNFLPNVPALGLAFMGWYFFYHFYEKQKTHWLYWSCLCFTIGGLLKITALLTFIPIMVVWFFETIGILKFRGNRRIFEARWAAIIPFALSIGLTVAWYLFAIQYNDTHATNYFRTTSWAIWYMDMPSIKYTFGRMIKYWSSHYYHLSMHLLTAFLLGWILFQPKKQSKFVYLLTLLSVIGTLLYILIWYYAFDLHDYYVINLVIVPVIAMVAGGIYLKNKYNYILRMWYFKIAIITLTVFNLAHAKQNLNDRYKPQSTHTIHFSPILYDVDGVRAFLKENNIERTDRVISIPDGSPNSTLYYLNLQGWTELYNYPFDTQKVKTFAGYGAKYLIVNDTSYLSKPELQGAFAKPIANYKRQLFIFDIQNLQ